VIGTPVGHFPFKAYQGAGIIAPIESERFKGFTTAILRFYKENPAAYVEKCRSIQDAARKFDWQYFIGDWVYLIEAAAAHPSRFDISANHLTKHRAKELNDLVEGALSSNNADRRPSLAENDHWKQGFGVKPKTCTAMLHQVHVINLDRSTGRLENFRKRNPHLTDFLRVTAIDGTTVDKTQLVSDGTITDDLAYSPGSLGCALSHVNLWKKAVSENRIVTIFEDDVICSLYFREESARILSKFANHWDVIQWGANFYPLFSWLDFGFSKAKLEFYDRHFSEDPVKFQSAKYSSHLIRVAHSFGTLAYSVSPKGAGLLLEYCLPLRNRIIPFPGTGVRLNDTGIDCPMCGAYSSMQAFLCIPPLVIHDDGQLSDRIETDRTTAESTSLVQ
jgi:GR25 family glycosyltransferase involved in LPS biosynthesis